MNRKVGAKRGTVPLPLAAKAHKPFTDAHNY